MFCPTCGSQLPNDARFCSSCGSALQIEQAPVFDTPAQTVFAPAVQPIAVPVEVEERVDPVVEQRKAELANEAMKLGIIGAAFSELGILACVWVFSIIFFPFIVLGLAFSGAAANRVKEYRELTGGEMVAKVRVGHIASRVGRIVGFVTLGIALFVISFILLFILLLVLDSLL